MMLGTMVAFGVLATALVAAYVLTGWVRAYALKAEMLDIPNARSSHDAPTPRGGGVALVAVVLAALPLISLWAALPSSGLAALWFGGAAVAAIGWLDDHTDVPARWRLLVHLVAAGWVVAWAEGAPPLPLPAGQWAWGLLGGGVLVLLISWIINLYNFMDGIDGIAGVEALTVAGIAAVLLWSLGAVGWALVAAIIAAASFGFLAWNWPPAKIFMGDGGSGFLGFVLAGLAVVTWSEAGLSVWSWLILLGAFIVDATITLMRRILRGERFYQAHRTHAYQHACRYYGSHRRVTVAVGLINLLWLGPLAWAAAVRPEWGIVYWGVAWMPLAALCIWFRAGVPG